MNNKKNTCIQIITCLIAVGSCWFSYLEKQNELTQLRLYAPKISQEIKQIQEENMRLRYQLQKNQSPEHLIQLSQESRFEHLKYPLEKDVLVIKERDNISHTSTNALAARGP